MTRTVDPNHPHVQALNKAGISTQRLNEMVNQDVASQLQHEAISQSPTLPAPDTQTMAAAQSMPYEFQYMLNQLINPEAPANPQVADLNPPVVNRGNADQASASN
jgi:hypothetical protein